MRAKHLRAGALALAAVALVGCKDATLGALGSGSVEGVVVDFETNQPIAGASVTTTPPSDVLVSDSAGRFALADLVEGNYQITARKFGYQQTTVSLAVRPMRATSATVFLQRADTLASRVMLNAEVLSFWNTVRGDTTFAEVEYRVSNAGGVKINAYDVNFRVTTTEGIRYQQERGKELGVGQTEIRRFQLYIQQARATEVKVESIWTDPSATS